MYLPFTQISADSFPINNELIGNKFLESDSKSIVNNQLQIFITLRKMNILIHPIWSFWCV